MDKKRICIVCVIMVFSIMTGYLFEKESKEEISMEPDVVSSISMKYFGQGNEFTNFDVVGTCLYLRVNTASGWKVSQL